MKNYNLNLELQICEDDLKKILHFQKEKNISFEEAMIDLIHGGFYSNYLTCTNVKKYDIVEKDGKYQLDTAEKYDFIYLEDGREKQSFNYETLESYLSRWCSSGCLSHDMSALIQLLGDKVLSVDYLNKYIAGSYTHVYKFRVKLVDNIFLEIEYKFYGDSSLMEVSVYQSDFYCFDFYFDYKDNKEDLKEKVDKIFK